jgi:flagellar biosynthesis/type III secretory pathway protein FliH
VRGALDGDEQAEFQALVDAAGPAVKEVVLKYTNQWIEQGWRDGEQAGLQKGLQKGERLGIAKGRHQAALGLLLRLLARRFGRVPVARRQALAAQPVEALERMAEAIFDLQSLDDLDRYLS